MLFFQDEGKTRPLLVYPVELVSKEGQFNAFIKEKKNLECCLSGDTRFLSG